MHAERAHVFPGVSIPLRYVRLDRWPDDHCHVHPSFAVGIRWGGGEVDDMSFMSLIYIWPLAQTRAWIECVEDEEEGWERKDRHRRVGGHVRASVADGQGGQ